MDVRRVGGRWRGCNVISRSVCLHLRARGLKGCYLLLSDRSYFFPLLCYHRDDNVELVLGQKLSPHLLLQFRRGPSLQPLHGTACFVKKDVDLFVDDRRLRFVYAFARLHDLAALYFWMDGAEIDERLEYEAAC